MGLLQLALGLLREARVTLIMTPDKDGTCEEGDEPGAYRCKEKKTQRIAHVIQQYLKYRTPPVQV